MFYELPKSVEINGTTYEIRTDYRAILGVCIALNDKEVEESVRIYTALDIFYVDFEKMPEEDYEEAVTLCFWFINGGEQESTCKRPRLMDWEQDFPYIVAPINRINGGADIREMEYMHYWTFLSLYKEIGECVFSQIVSIRDKQSRGIPLDKTERDWLKRNRNLVEFKRKYTEADDELIKKYT